MNISRPACMGSTVEASKVRKNRKIFAFKKFILPHCLDSATPPRPNERDPNSRVVKMQRKEEKKRRGKGKRKEEKFGDLIAKKKRRSPWAWIFPWCPLRRDLSWVELDRRTLGESLLYLLSFMGQILSISCIGGFPNVNIKPHLHLCCDFQNLWPSKGYVKKC